ncbi:HET-domain-containing protein [Hypoxylon sp. FL1284]|nr:HET-domain-containing protein [Hypoxylon sp. FL1284]
MPVFNRYQYQRLFAEDEIRLVELRPATREEDPLICSIIHYCRSAQNVDYCAVSYVWGEPVFSRNLEIRCDNNVSYVRVTASVEPILRRLRAPDTAQYLWIDAVCLNQADEMEKAHQIPGMGRIFGEAKEVHIWLRHEDRLTEKLFTFLREACLLPAAKKSDMAGQMGDLMKSLYGDGIRALQCYDELCKRPWFSRRWIIQEACLARQATVHCGSHSIPLPSVVQAAIRFQTTDMSYYPVKVMANLRSPTAEVTILELLWNFQESGCLDPKDRVAALVGLAQDRHQLHLDYTAHWTEIYKQVVLDSLTRNSNDSRLQVMLHLFEFGAVSVPDDTSYPSWVPDWSKSRLRDLPYHSFIRNLDTYEYYPSSPGHSSKATLTSDRGALQVQWRPSPDEPRCRQVVYVTSFDGPHQSEGHKVERMTKVLLVLFPPGCDSTRQILAFSSLIRTVTLFRLSGRDPKLKDSPSDILIKNFTRRLPETSRSKVFDSLRQMDRVLGTFYLFQLESIDPDHQVGTGYGVCSQQVQIGDIVVPLWTMEWKNDITRNVNSGETTVTMLVVRRVKKEEVGTGHVVGWAVCVLVDNEASHRNISPAYLRWKDFLPYRSQQCTMRLL